MTEQTALILGGALFSAEGKLLLLCRKTGEWELPGGRPDFGEAPEVALERLFAQATGIDVALDRPLGTWSAVETENDAHRHVVYIAYTVRCAGAFLGADIDTDEFAASAWLFEAEALARVQAPAMCDAAKRAFAALTRTRKNG